MLCAFIPTVEEETIRFGQLNAKGSKTVLQELRKIAEDEKLDIICLQEPYTKSGKIPYWPVKTQILVKGNKPQAAIIIVNNNVKATTITQHSDEWTICAELHTKIGKFMLICSYFQYSHEITPYISRIKEICNTFNNKKIILAIDANAKSVLWHSRLTDARGELFEEAIMELNLEIVNRPGNPPTYHSRAGAKSNIDVTLASRQATDNIVNWEVTDGATISDHNLIYYGLKDPNTNTTNATEQSEQMYNVNKINWIKFRNLISLPVLQQGQNLNAYVQHLVDNIKSAIKESSPQTKAKIKTITTNYWNDRLEKFRRTSRSLRKSYQRAIDYNTKQYRLQLYREAKRNFEKELLKARTESWEKYVNDQVKLDPWGTPYKIVSEKIRSPTIMSTLRTTDGSHTRGWRESVELLMRVLLPDDSIEEDEEHHKIMRELSERTYFTGNRTKPFTEEEVMATIKKLKKKKSPGPDGIRSEVLQQISNILVPHITQLFNQCLKQRKYPDQWKLSNLVIIKKGEDKDPEEPKSYRPVCLIDPLGKVFEKLLM